MLPNPQESKAAPRKRSQPPMSSPGNGVEQVADDAEMEAGETADGPEDAAGEVGGGVETPEVVDVETGEAPGTYRQAVGKIEERHPDDRTGKTIDRKGWVATTGGISDQAADISPRFTPSDQLSVGQYDQHSPQQIIDSDEQALGPVSSGRKRRNSPSFDRDYRAMAAALALRQNRHQSPVDLDQLIQEGRLICSQFHQQAQKLQKQKILVDEMLSLLGSPMATVEE